MFVFEDVEIEFNIVEGENLIFVTATVERPDVYRCVEFQVSCRDSLNGGLYRALIEIYRFIKEEGFLDVWIIS
ncbi:hypothetical protein NVP1101O_211 [Vibrio phage 1.101.O._10N.261.45.C6]|nr:hypothetical protein NVP1101O_211 [Vibrio phage 1.101.O._10N.261.45.C6]